MLKKIFITFLVIAVFLLTGLLYLNKVFLPIQMRQILSQKAQKFLGRDITYKEIVFEPFRGIVIKNLVIFQKGDSRTPFLSVDEVTASVLLPSIFKDFQIIIPSVTLHKPFLHLIRSQAGQWNYHDLLNPETRDSSKAPPVLIVGINVQDGRLQITDRYVTPFSLELWDKVNAKANLSFNKNINFELELQNPAKNILIKTAGHYNLNGEDMAAQVHIQNFNFAKYFNLFYQSPDYLITQGFIQTAHLALAKKKDSAEIHGDLIMSADIQQSSGRYFRGQVSVQNLAFSRQNENFELGIQLVGKKLSLQLADDQSFKGDVSTQKLHLRKNNQELSANGELDLTNAVVLWTKANQVHGDISLRDLQFVQNPTDLNLKLSLSSVNAGIEMGENSFQGGIDLKNLNLNRRNKVFTANGDCTLTNANIAFLQNNKLRGTITVKGLNFKGSTENYQGGVQVSISQPIFTNDAVTFKADSLSLPLEVLTQNRQINVLTSLELPGPDIQLGQGRSVKANKILGKNITAAFIDGKTRIKADITTDQLIARLGKGQEFLGSPQIKLDVQNDPLNIQSWRYRGQAIVNAATFKGAPMVGDVQQITGKIDFEPDRIKSDNLTMNALHTAVNLSGTVSNFQDPNLNLLAAADNVDLATLRPFFAEQLKKLDVHPTGLVDVKLQYNGPLASPAKAQINGTAILHNVSMTGKKLPGPVSGMTGIIRGSTNYLAWENVKATLQKNIYTLNGELRDFDNPSVNVQVDSPDLLLNAKFKVAGNLISLSTFNGRYLDSGFDLTGKVQMQDADPFWDVTGHLTLHLTDLPQLFPKSDLKDLHPSGEMDADFSFKGQPKNFSRAKIILTAASPQVSLNTFKLTDLTIDFRHGGNKNGRIKINGNFYNGKLNIDGFTTIQSEPALLHLKGELTGTDLAQMHQDNKWKGQNVSGTMSALVELEGPLADPNQLHGQGAFSIQHGLFGGINFLKGIWKALLIPELENVQFTDASANFTIQKSRVMTNDLFFKGTVADLMGKGWIDFKSNLNLDVNPKIKETQILQSSSMLRKGPTAVLAATEGYLKIKITGTLKHPQYNVSTNPGQIIKQTTGNILEGMGDILDGILSK